MKPILIFGKYCLALLSREQVEHLGLNRELFQRLTIRNQTLTTRAELAKREAQSVRKVMAKMQAKYEKKIETYKKQLSNTV